MPQKRNHPGIVVRHSKHCPTVHGGDCTTGRKGGCVPVYEAWIWDKRSKTKIRKRFPTLAAAKGWRADATSQARRGQLQQETRETVRQVAEEWLDKARKGEVLARTRVRYKPSVLRGYEAALERYVFDDLGAARLSDLRRTDVQLLVDRLVGSGLSGSTVRNAIIPLQVVARYAVKRKGLLVNPTADLELPAPAGHRERAASVTEAEVLLDALPVDVRDVYASGLYAGLRRGELRALRVSDLHLDPDEHGAVWISVERGWDDVEGEIAPKSKAGIRRALVPERLREMLAARVQRTGRAGGQLVFGSDGKRPFVPNTVRRNAERAWAAVAVGAFLRGELPRGIELDPIALHDTRHTHRSWLAAAGVPKERRDWWLGHAGEGVGASYEHELAGQLADDAARLNTYLDGTPAQIVPLRAAS